MVDPYELQLSSSTLLPSSVRIHLPVTSRITQYHPDVLGKAGEKDARYIQQNGGQRESYLVGTVSRIEPETMFQPVCFRSGRQRGIPPVNQLNSFEFFRIATLWATPVVMARAVVGLKVYILTTPGLEYENHRHRRKAIQLSKYGRLLSSLKVLDSNNHLWDCLWHQTRNPYRTSMAEYGSTPMTRINHPASR